MSAKLISIAQLQAQYSGSYAFNVTHEPDPDYRKFLARQIGLSHHEETFPVGAQPLDISLDDVEGDVVAGVSGFTLNATLTVDMLWVGQPIREQGIGRRLMQMVEEAACERGCKRARVRTPHEVAFFVGMGYQLSGTVQTLPFRNLAASVSAQAPQAIYWLEKIIAWR